MDFSHAGYMGGGVALPDVPVKKTIEPSGGDDDTATIQAAIDEVSKLPLENGWRGAVLLAPGTYPCEGTIRISTSGVVLRGSGADRRVEIHDQAGRPAARCDQRRRIAGSPPRRSSSWRTRRNWTWRSATTPR